MPTRRVRLGVHVLCFLLGAAGAAAAGPESTIPSTAGLIGDLAAPQEAIRFDAIVALTQSNDAGLDKLLREARATPPFRESPPGRAALEFVRLKRARLLPKPAAPPSRAGMNVVLISLDTVRADHLGCYGYHRKTTPNIDSVAKRGVVFERAQSPSSWTLPVHMSVFTSLYPSFHGVERGAEWFSGLPKSERTMAQYLKDEGFATAALVSNPFLDAHWGFDRGFDLYARHDVDAAAQSDMASLWLQWQAYRSRLGPARSNFFLFVHYNDAHSPPNAPAAFPEKFPVEKTASEDAVREGGPCAPKSRPRPLEGMDEARSLYDADINFVDTHLGRLFQALEDLGLTGSTLLILMADHGEEFGEHGMIKHKLTLYEEVLRVPLIVTYPAALAPGQRIEESVSLLDILPTVLDTAGQKIPSKLQGISLLPFLRRSGSAAPGRVPESRILFSDLGPLGLPWDMPFHRKAVRTGQYK